MKIEFCQLIRACRSGAVVKVDLPLKHPFPGIEAVIGGISGGQSHDRQRDQGKGKDDFFHAHP